MTTPTWLLVAVPMIGGWCIWVTTSLFNQRQEIALLKQNNKHLKDIKELICTRLEE